ncbi:integrase catalytic domain-containing protein [Trichonephila clavata]|uniref:Integrase catalytic domain-containing protein n=1 Tax=Trichonephila clavata TaxID=2740835 RepID=A0A8X6LB31_TRICU|nr:integrase catalytic domain-containing protein [Trichonephila clavata]
MYRQTYPIAAKHIQNSACMDGFVMETSTDTAAIILYREMLQLTSHISLPLTQWTTNSKILLDILVASKEPVTQRLLLKLMSKFYVPLCLFAPVTVIVKILFQDRWLSGIKWDELLPPAVAQQWHKWINQLQCMNDIPRWIGFSKISDVTINVFCDAS